MSCLKNNLIWLGVLALATPICSAEESFKLHDVALNHNGVLVGQMVDANGVPATDAVFSIAKKGEAAVSVKTRENGKFVVPDLRGGHYQVVSAQGTSHFRLWSNGTAPKNAMKGMLLVSTKQVARGQCDGCTDPTCGSCTESYSCGCGGAGCSSCGGGYGGGLISGKTLLGAAGIGLAAWAIVELADDDDGPAS